MSSTIIYSDYNGFPGSEDTYDFRSGEESPIFPDVTLYESFDYTLKSTGADARDSPTEVEEDGDDDLDDSDITPGGSKPTRNGESTSPRYGYSSVFVAKVPTAMRWVTNQGPDGDGAAVNEKGDWFSAEVLGKADRFGPGIRLDEVPRSGTETLYYVQEDTARGTQTAQYTATAWNYLKIHGAYNAAVFPYNEFAYTDEYPTKDNGYTTGGGEVDSLFELPGKFNALHKFIPDQRDQTTLTFTVEVDWIRVFINSGYGQYMDQTQKDAVLAGFDGKGVTASGTDTHTVNHVVFNDTSNWKQLLEETLEKQYTTEEQWKNGGQDFPFRTFDLNPAEAQSGTETTPFLEQIKDTSARAIALGVAGETTITITTTTSGKPKVGDFVYGTGIGDGAVVLDITRKEKDTDEFYGTVDNAGFFTAIADSGDFFVSNTEKFKLLEVPNLTVNPADGGTDLGLTAFAFTVSADRTTVTVDAGAANANKTVKLRAKVFAKVPQTDINLSVPNTATVNGQILFKKGE